MIIVRSKEHDKFVVEPWMELEPFDPKLIKEIKHNHPYKILLSILNKFYSSYFTFKENEDVTDFYFKTLDDYNRYGIAFQRKFELLPDNKLGVIEYKDFGKTVYSLINNWFSKKTLLFNNIKTIDLKQHDRGEKPLSEEEKLKRDLIKKQTNKKLQVALMDPYIYNNDELFKDAIEKTNMQNFLIKMFDLRMTYYGSVYFFSLKFD